MGARHSATGAVTGRPVQENPNRRTGAGKGLRWCRRKDSQLCHVRTQRQLELKSSGDGAASCLLSAYCLQRHVLSRPSTKISVSYPGLKLSWSFTPEAGTWRSIRGSIPAVLAQKTERALSSPKQCRVVPSPFSLYFHAGLIPSIMIFKREQRYRTLRNTKPQFDPCQGPSQSEHQFKYLIPPHLKKFFLAGSPPEDYFPLGWISYGTNPPHLKEFFLGGFKNLSAGFLFCLRRRKATAPQKSAAYCF